MSSNFADTAGNAAVPAPPAARPLGTTLVTLVRREFWEHRVLWLCPLIVAGLLALSPLFETHVVVDVPPFSHAVTRVALATIVQWALWAPLNLAMVICVAFYLLDALYAERRDRSILFWKSLPVSDGVTVLSKLLVGSVLMPLAVFALALVTYLVFTGLFAVRAAASGVPMLFAWNTGEWFRSELALFLLVLLGILWYAPIAAYLLVISAWARRSPLLWATLPPLLAPLLEHMIFGTHYLWDFVSYRTSGIWRTLGLGHSHIVTHNSVRPVGTLLAELDFRGAFTDLDLWLGVAVAAALVYLTIRLRRYRDDT